MKRKVINAVFILVYVIGALVFLKPDLESIGAKKDNYTATKRFEQTVAEKEAKKETEEDSSSGEDLTDEETEKQPLEALLQEMQAYNQTIYENGQSGLADPWDYEQAPLDLGRYGIEDNVVGLLSIPRMDVELPIYLGATKENMAKGAVLMGQTSFPLGETNTNAVIAAHRGWKGIPMFREIEKLELGDTLTIRNYWETLTYQVTDIQVIMPDDVDAVLIREGKDMVTLLTCHPYTKHYRRYAVFCENVDAEADAETAPLPDIEETTKEEAQLVRTQAIAEDAEHIQSDRMARIIGYAGIVILGIVLLLGLFGKKEKTKQE